MKKFYWILFVMLALSCKTQPDAVRKLTHNKQINPPGTVWLRDSIYMDQTEVNNINYLEYLLWLQKNDLEKYTAALPDTTIWLKPPFYNPPYAQYYLRHPAYRYYPVVGVSYEQAKTYCKWRTERVKSFYDKNISPKAKGYKNFKNFEYRLPTKAEWEYAAFAGNINSKYGYQSIIAKNNFPKVWVKEVMILYGGENADIFVPVDSRAPNSFGFYGMIGNVSEMIAEEGISKGGSVFNFLEECEIKKCISYTKPSAILGFRCVCEVH